jgi:hypothetical protein
MRPRDSPWKGPPRAADGADGRSSDDDERRRVNTKK